MANIIRYVFQSAPHKIVKIIHQALLAANQLAVSDDHLLYAWGNGELGQCGLGTYPQIYTLPQVVKTTIGCQVKQVSHREIIIKFSTRHEIHML